MAVIKERDHLFDNMKFILILLVVFGHICFTNRNIPSMAGLTNMIYTFHMPLFIFVSGYFSKSVKTHRKSDILHLLVPYIIIELLNYAYTSLTGLGEGKLNMLTPTYQNWYLLALFFWRLLTPYFKLFKRHTAITGAFVIALTVGFFNGFSNFLALYRVFYFLPFFILGYYCADLKLVLDKFKKYKTLFIVFFCLVMIAVFTLSFMKTKLAVILLFAYLPVTGYDHQLSYFILRTVAMGSSILICFSLCYLIPARKTWFSRFGENTLYVFLFHMMIVWAVNPYFFPYHPGLSEILLLLLAGGITWLLSWQPVISILRPLIYPDYLLTLIKTRKNEQV
jgi:fucose 4-O-acetylase-like acetyltransferase